MRVGDIDLLQPAQVMAVHEYRHLFSAPVTIWPASRTAGWFGQTVYRLLRRRGLVSSLARPPIRLSVYPPFPHCPRHGVSGTGVSGGLPSAQANRFETTQSAIARRVLTDAEPTCGRSTVFSSAMSSCGTLGSFSKTSRPRPKSSCSAAPRSAPSRRPSEPRATLINTPSGPSACKTSALMMCRVPGPPGATTIRTSEALAMSMSEE